MLKTLKPRSREWTAPSILFGCLIGICDDAEGRRYLCQLKDKSKEWDSDDWEIVEEATPLVIGSFETLMQVRDELFGPAKVKTQ